MRPNLPSARFFIVAAVITLVLLASTARHAPKLFNSKPSLYALPIDERGLTPYTQSLFEQTLSDQKQDLLSCPGITAMNAKAPSLDGIYLNCTGIGAGLTTIMSQVRFCLFTALQLGTNIVLPVIDERDSEDLQDFHHDDLEFQHDYNVWFEEEHIIEALKIAVPHVDVVSSRAELNVRQRGIVDVRRHPNFAMFRGLFESLNPPFIYFNETLKTTACDDKPCQEPFSRESFDAEGTIVTNRPTVIEFPWTDMIYNLDNYASGVEQLAWNELNLLTRFKSTSRHIVDHTLNRVMSHSPAGRFIGAHYRVERDTAGYWWDNAETQGKKIITSAEEVWSRFGLPGRPIIYLACGDPQLMEEFRLRAALRNITVHDKWTLSSSAHLEDVQIRESMTPLGFDMLAGIDYGVLLKSVFFIGNDGSAFSVTIANNRSPHGRYGTSGLLSSGTGNSHLFKNCMIPTPLVRNNKLTSTR